jgi:hypothetical protein
MPVTDHQVAALRAHVTGDFEEYKRLTSQFDKETDKIGWAALIAAGFYEAVDRRFANSSDEIVEYVGSVRARSDRAAEEIDPVTAERLVRYALAGGQDPDVDGRTRALTQMVLLAVLVHDSSYDEQELERFLTEVRRFADQMID